MGYEYYEFQSVDRSLTDEERRELNEFSSRATATRQGISFEYHYSDLGAEPLDLLERYFDAGLYLSKYGTRRFLLRLPDLDGLPETLRPYEVDQAFTVASTRRPS